MHRYVLGAGLLLVLAAFVFLGVTLYIGTQVGVPDNTPGADKAFDAVAKPLSRAILFGASGIGILGIGAILALIRAVTRRSQAGPPPR